MRIPRSLRSLLLAAPALLAAACSSNPATQPLVGVGGWSWAPDEAGDRPLPVIWVNGGPPQRLPLVEGGNCPASGSVQAIASSGSSAMALGISVVCTDGQPRMLPVGWPGEVVQPYGLPGPDAQGTVLAATVLNGQVYAVGAVGTTSPLPAVWVDGELKTRDPGFFLPPGIDAALLTSIAPTTKYVLATGIAHLEGSQPPVFFAAAWIFDTDFLVSSGEVLPLPPGVDASYGPAVYAATVADQAITTAAMVSPSGAEMPLVWFNLDPQAPFGTDFATGPLTSPTSIALVSGTPYSGGYVRTPAATSRPQPAIWALDVLSVLSTADATTALGAGEGLSIFQAGAYVSGESCQPHPADPSLLVSTAALWSNGDRMDLAPLVPPGSTLPIQAPVFGWWRVPGTPATSPPDWPFPGGFPAILESAAVAAAGSAVGRAVVTVPPGP